MTIAEFLHDWLLLRSPELKPRTIDSYRDQIERIISPMIGEINAEELSVDDVRHLLASIIEAGHERTAEMVYTLLNCALAELDHNPMSKIRRPRHRQKHPTPWSDEQITRYVIACQTHPHGLALLLAICCGLRRGEICGLRWKSVDLVNQELDICNQRITLANGQTVDCDPKSESSVRRVPIPLELLPRLRREIGHPEAYVTCLTPSGLSQAHSTLVDRLGLPKIGLHGLRHSFATSSMRNNGDAKALQEILGHSSYAVTMNIYTHPDHAMKSKAIDKSVGIWYTVLHTHKT